MTRDPNPAIKCIVCGKSETDLNQVFVPLLNGVACEEDLFAFYAAKDTGGEEFDPQAWLIAAQQAAGNVPGIPVPGDTEEG